MEGKPLYERYKNGTFIGNSLKRNTVTVVLPQWEIEKKNWVC